MNFISRYLSSLNTLRKERKAAAFKAALVDELEQTIDSISPAAMNMLQRSYYVQCVEVIQARDLVSEVRRFLEDGWPNIDYTVSEIIKHRTDLTDLIEMAFAAENFALVNHIPTLRADVLEMLKYAKEHNLFAFQHFQLVPADWTGLEQDFPGYRSIEDIQQRGGTACMAGLLNLWPAFDHLPMMRPDVMPTLMHDSVVLNAQASVAAILGVPYWFAGALSMSFQVPGDLEDRHVLYNKAFEDITVDDVIAVIEKLIDGMSPEDLMVEAITTRSMQAGIHSG